MFGGSILPSDRIDDSIHENGTIHNLPEPVRIIHKEQESISAFCLNQVDTFSPPSYSEWRVCFNKYATVDNL